MITQIRFALIFAAVALAGCSDTSEPSKAGTFSGPTLQVGGGEARSVVTLDRDGNPVSMAVAISDGAVENPPTPPAGMMWAEHTLALPAEAAGTVFDHLTLDWNPHGHPPIGIFNLPHFDIHFYTISVEKRNTMLPSDPAFAEKGHRLPAAEFIPQGYISPDPETIPRMGRHWIDPSSPEFNGEPFTATFIYGSYDGEMIFLEPMVTRAFLQTRPNFVRPLKLPARYAVPGHYPSSYRVTYDASANEHRITLGDFVRRD
ncbi:DUF5602 domain-containing protein [soil metagenome]